MGDQRFEVLIVDDDAAVRDMTRRVLRALGVAVLPAATGEEALDCLEQHRCVRLVISDVAMPGMDGRALARAVLARRPDVIVVLTSGQAIAGIPDGVRVLAKPWRLAHLKALLAGAGVRLPAA